MRIEFNITEEEAQILQGLYEKLEVGSAKELILEIPGLLRQITIQKDLLNMAIDLMHLQTTLLGTNFQPSS